MVPIAYFPIQQVYCPTEESPLYMQQTSSSDICTELEHHNFQVWVVIRLYPKIVKTCFFTPFDLFFFWQSADRAQRRLVKNSFIVELSDGHRKLRHLFLFNDVIACAKYKVKDFIFCWPCSSVYFLLITNLMHFSNVFIYFTSLHVSSNPVLIRRINCISTSSGIYHSV